jgi:hypothetical protein
MTESIGNNENLNDFGTTVIKTHFRLSALTVLTDKFEIYHQRFIFDNNQHKLFFFNVV